MRHYTDLIRKKGQVRKWLNDAPTAKETSGNAPTAAGKPGSVSPTRRTGQAKRVSLYGPTPGRRAGQDAGGAGPR